MVAGGGFEGAAGGASRPARETILGPHPEPEGRPSERAPRVPANFAIAAARIQRSAVSPPNTHRAGSRYRAGTGSAVASCLPAGGLPSDNGEACLLETIPTEAIHAQETRIDFCGQRARPRRPVHPLLHPPLRPPRAR